MREIGHPGTGDGKTKYTYHGDKRDALKGKGSVQNIKWQYYIFMASNEDTWRNSHNCGKAVLISDRIMISRINAKPTLINIIQTSV